MGYMQAAAAPARLSVVAAAVVHITAKKTTEAFSFRGGRAPLLSEFSKTRRTDTEKDCILISLEYLDGKLKHWPVGFGNKLIRHFMLANLSPQSPLISSRFLLWVLCVCFKSVIILHLLLLV